MKFGLPPLKVFFSELAPKLKHSRFRHVFAKSIRRSEWYDTGPGHGIAVAANPKMIALAIDVPAGGVVQVAKLCTMGRGHMEMAKIKDHEVWCSIFLSQQSVLFIVLFLNSYFLSAEYK